MWLNVVVVNVVNETARGGKVRWVGGIDVTWEGKEGREGEIGGDAWEGEREGRRGGKYSM